MANPIDLILLAMQNVSLDLLRSEFDGPEEAFHANWTMAVEVAQALAAAPPSKPEIVDMLEQSSSERTTVRRVATPYGPQPSDWFFVRAAEHITAGLALSREKFAPSLVSEAWRACAICGEHFEAQSHNQAFCGHECRVARERLRKRRGKANR